MIIVHKTCIQNINKHGTEERDKQAQYKQTNMQPCKETKQDRDKNETESNTQK